MNFNGWFRVTLVAAILWSLFVFADSWIDASDHAHFNAQQAFGMCQKDKDRTIDCYDEYTSVRKNSMNYFIERWDIILVDIALPIVAILIAWILNYVSVKVFFWIKKGFSDSFTPRNTLKYSCMTTLAVCLCFMIFQLVSSINTRWDEEAFDIAIGECDFAQIKSQIPKTRRDEFMNSCMKSKGYTFQFFKQGCLNYAAQLRSCYK